jgi:hypothetical protein
MGHPRVFYCGLRGPPANASAVGKQALGGGEGPSTQNASGNRGGVSGAGRALRSLRSADDGRNERQEENNP